MLALEWADRNVRVNAIGPVFVITDMTKGLYDHPELRTQILAQTPLNRFAEPSEITPAALFFASDASSYVTGQTIYVDGGWLSR